MSEIDPRAVPLANLLMAVHYRPNTNAEVRAALLHIAAFDFLRDATPQPPSTGGKDRPRVERKGERRRPLAYHLMYSPVFNKRVRLEDRRQSKAQQQDDRFPTNDGQLRDINDIPSLYDVVINHFKSQQHEVERLAEVAAETACGHSPRILAESFQYQRAERLAASVRHFQERADTAEAELATANDRIAELTAERDRYGRALHEVAYFANEHYAFAGDDPTDTKWIIDTFVDWAQNWTTAAAERDRLQASGTALTAELASARAQLSGADGRRVTEAEVDIALFNAGIGPITATTTAIRVLDRIGPLYHAPVPPDAGLREVLGRATVHTVHQNPKALNLYFETSDDATEFLRLAREAKAGTGGDGE